MVHPGGRNMSRLEDRQIKSWIRNGERFEGRARVALGYDVAAEKQERKVDAIEKIEAKKNAFTAGQLADEYFTKNILGRVLVPTRCIPT